MEAAIEPHGVKLSKSEILGLSALTRFANNISPSYMGTAIRALYLKKTYGVSYAKFASSFAFGNIIQVVVAGVIAVLILFSVAEFTNEQDIRMILLLSVLLLVIFLIMPVSGLSRYLMDRSGKTKKRKAKILERLSAMVSEYGKLRSRPILFVRMIIWTLVALLSTAASIYFIYLSLGESVSPLLVLFIAILGGLSILISITPGNIGISEGMLVLGAQLMGVPIPVTLAMAIVRRLFMYLVTFVLASYFAPKLLNTSFIKMGNFAKEKTIEKR